MSTANQEWVRNLRLHGTSQDFPDLAIRWKPDAIDLPEKLGFTLTTHVAGLSALKLLQRTLLHSVTVSGQTELKSVEAPYLTDVSANLAIKTNAGLASLSVPNLRLPTFGGSVTGSSLDFSGNALTAAAVDALFNRLALSLSSGHGYYCVINTSGGTSAAPTAASSLARSSLYLTATAYHITVTTN